MTMTRAPHDALDEFDELEPTDVTRACPLHPALVAAGLSIASGIQGHGQLSGIVVVMPWDAAWCKTVSDAWDDLPSLKTRHPLLFTQFIDWPIDGRWYVVTCDRKPLGERETHDIADALERQRPVCLISTDPEQQIPQDLLAAVDVRVYPAAPTPQMINKVAERLTGTKSTVSLGAEACAALTPYILKLAMRENQSADDYIWRLAKLTAPKADEIARDRAIDLDDLCGMDEAVAWGHALAADLQAFGAGKLPWAAVDRGVLLAGAPGVGKTTFARALATTCGVSLVVASYSQWQSSKGGHLGDLLKAMRATFDEARKKSPCILFIDEIDSFHKRGTGADHDDWWAAVVGGLLELLDGVQKRDGVVVVAATNHPEIVDPALKRSGRLDRVISIPLRDQKALAGILKVHLGADLVGADLMPVAAYALGASGADCERWVRGARRRARVADRSVQIDDLIGEILGGDGAEPARRPREILVHEAGHALLMAIEQPGALKHVSVVARGDKGGSVVWSVGSSPNADKIRVYIRQMLAGRAAEFVTTGSVSSGAGGSGSSDLAQATQIAVAAETSLGLADMPLVWRGTWTGESLGALLLTNPALARRVHQRMEGEWRTVVAVVRENRASLESIVAELEKRPVLSGSEVEAIVAASPGVRLPQPNWRSRVKAAAGMLRLPVRAASCPASNP